MEFVNLKVKMTKHNLKSEKIAVIAGSGKLPQLIINELIKQKISFIILAIHENADEELLRSHKHYLITPGKVKPILKTMSDEKITSVVFAGDIKRPGLLSLKVDSIGLSVMARITASKIHGDNSALSIIAKFLEEHGLKVISPNSILPSLLTPAGILGKIKPDQDDLKDIEIGKIVLAKLSDMDIGQATIVENSYVLGIEASEGTDSLIKRCADLKRETMRKGVLVKMKKTMQDKRLDLPTIGTNTIDYVYKANLRGIAVNTNGSIIISLPEVITLADKYGIFVIGVQEI
jgi:DUF1009 family protein